MGQDFVQEERKKADEVLQSFDPVLMLRTFIPINDSLRTPEDYKFYKDRTTITIGAIPEESALNQAVLRDRKIIADYASDPQRIISAWAVEHQKTSEQAKQQLESLRKGQPAREALLQRSDLVYFQYPTIFLNVPDQIASLQRKIGEENVLFFGQKAGPAIADVICPTTQVTGVIITRAAFEAYVREHRLGLGGGYRSAGYEVQDVLPNDHKPTIARGANLSTASQSQGGC